MARLPQPGGDNGNWGTILNDYLSQSHSADGSLKDGSVSEAKLDSATQSKLNQSAPTWSTLAGKPTVIAAGADATTARATISAVGKGELVINVLDYGAVGNGVADDTAAINAALTYAGNNGGGVVQLMRNHLVSGPLLIPETTTLCGKGGHSGTRGTVITSSATSEPVCTLTARTSRLEQVRILSTTARRTATTTTGHGVYIGGTDVAMASYPFFSRVGLFDVDIRNQPTDGVHAIGTMEMARFDQVTASDCARHGFVMDGGGVAGWSNAQLGPFMVTLYRCRAIECGGQAFICLSTGGYAPQGLRLDEFEALGCAWDSTKRNIASGDSASALFQIQIGGRGHVFTKIDVEDQQYAATTTTSTAVTRTALSVPSKGVYSVANGVHVIAPFFSSLVQSWLQIAGSSGIIISYPTIFSGTYGTAQSPAIQVATTCYGIDINYLTTMCTGATTVLQNQSLNARIFADGIPWMGLNSSITLGWSDGLTPVAVTLASDILATNRKRTQVNGEGGVADNLSTIRINSGNNGQAGTDIFLIRGSQDITVKHGVGNIINSSGADIVMTATANLVLHYFYNGTSWVQV